MDNLRACSMNDVVVEMGIRKAVSEPYTGATCLMNCSHCQCATISDIHVGSGDLLRGPKARQ